MLAPPPQQMKTCSKCYRLLPVESYHFADKPAGKRRSVCPNCRRQHDQDRRRASRQKVLSRELRSIRRTQSVENLWALVMNLCTQLGGLSNVLKLIRERILDEQTSSACRCSATRALLHMVAVSDKERMRLQQMGDQVQLRQLASAHLEQLRRLADQEQSPEEFIRRLHAEGKLVPIIRVMLDDGTLTLDDIESPPHTATTLL